MTIDDSLAMPPETMEYSVNGAYQPEQEIQPGWQVFNLADAYIEREPTRYIVDGILAEASLNIMYAPPAAMKSMLLADLACCVAAGKPWLEGPSGGVKVMRRPVLWIDMDNGERRTHERFNELGKGHNLTPDAPLNYVSMPVDPLLHLTDLEAVEHLIYTIRDYQAGLVVMDNLGLIAGDVDENSAKMAEVMSYLRTTAERTGAAIIVIHHQRKGGTMAGGRLGDSLRGHSSIEAALDLALHVVREPGESMLTISSTKTRGVDVPVLRAKFNYQHRPGTKDLALAWFEEWAPTRGENPIRDAILEVLGKLGESTKGRLADEVYEHLGQSTGINKIRNWIGEMATVTGEIVEETGENNAKLLRLK